MAAATVRQNITLKRGEPFQDFSFRVKDEEKAPVSLAGCEVVVEILESAEYDSDVVIRFSVTVDDANGVIFPTLTGAQTGSFSETNLLGYWSAWVTGPATDNVETLVAFGSVAVEEAAS